MLTVNRSALSRIVFSGVVACAAAFGQYKADAAGAPPSDVPAGISQALAKQGTKITDAKGSTIAEIWLVSTMPTGPSSSEQNVTLPTVPQGALLGVIHFPAAWYDRRGQTIKPGTYTLRYSMFPQNGDHQGVAPQRDFFILSRVADDTDAKATPAFDPLMTLSRKASGTSHPLVMSIWKADDPAQNFTQQGEDWVLQRKAGDTNLAIIVVGKAA